MPIITLTTDWNKDDFYIGAVKGAIYSQCSDVTIVDISHKIKPFNIYQAAFIIKNSYKYYPKGTVHILGIKTEITKGLQHLIAEHEGQYFIGSDNGIFSLIFKDNEPAKIFALKEHSQSSFPELDVFSSIACKIIIGEKIDSIGNKVKEINRRVPLRPTIEESVISGSVVYIDSFQNAITNISSYLFERVGNNRPFKIYVQSNHYVISKINNSYQETSVGELLAIFNSLNLLEVAINGGNAAELLNLDINSSIRITFK